MWRESNTKGQGSRIKELSTPSFLIIVIIIIINEGGDDGGGGGDNDDGSYSSLSTCLWWLYDHYLVRSLELPQQGILLNRVAYNKAKAQRQLVQSHTARSDRDKISTDLWFLRPCSCPPCEQPPSLSSSTFHFPEGPTFPDLPLLILPLLNSSRSRKQN